MNADQLVTKLLEAGEERDFERYSDDIANERMSALKTFCREVQDLLIEVDSGNGERSPIAHELAGREESRWMFLWERLDEIRTKFGL